MKKELTVLKDKLHSVSQFLGYVTVKNLCMNI